MTNLFFQGKIIRQSNTSTRLQYVIGGVLKLPEW